MSQAITYFGDLLASKNGEFDTVLVLPWVKGRRLGAWDPSGHLHMAPMFVPPRLEGCDLVEGQHGYDVPPEKRQQTGIKYLGQTKPTNFEDLLDEEAWRQAGLIIKETRHSHGRNLHSETRPAPLFEAVLEFEAGMLQPPPRRKKPMLATTTYSD
ncbi:predicted protein [Histoplasma capsulatum var. duboisii H88]|uniref:Predicted protein n=1 Tax=Ajellomyces capsulatus (strain H88) TaxID=544711 RepID=F0UFJ8_AJEC8|nr:predicted protein [Histoplasma capsulatum var. duboisii H88]